ncbi:uncharacterized protein K460DRAFT_394133 [Cucurbitaria berberidis CBS 394.84]|uniref:Uncharacterized protein n=1 Tax=Cucurbitaria berberidis CBS 394.84 TaxID=1168544 RepID=A0A9P4GPD3_9PLEO|nr:uncharacterized protein K460DRAFT_394133 [Cucurbitaria berberidis CBS 394.84]KAF1849270.1 hypothetical protein K460DRAFT_394133 [Cucurbitaria berberidis CBS 394.84]
MVMRPKNSSGVTPESSTATQEVDNSNSRSVFGDNHAATEDAMMVAHAKYMREAGQIDDKMEAELSKAWHKSGELHRKYTPAYLAMLPNYTGQNQDEMPSYETALRHQKARDDAQEQLLADFMAGKIDENGNRIDGRDGPSSSIPSGGERDKIDDSTNELSTKTNGSPKKGKTLAMKSSQPTLVTVPSRYTQHLPASTSAPRSNAQTAVSDIEAATTIVTSSDSSQPSSSSSSQRTKARSKAKSVVQPLTPLFNRPSYTEVNYYELLDLCRNRKIHGRGTEQQVRNALIQDDINIALGHEREMIKSQGRRKAYKHQAPAELKNGNVANGGSQGKDSDETLSMGSSEGVHPRTNVVGKKTEIVTDAEVSEAESESAFEDLRAVCCTERKQGIENDEDGSEGEGGDSTGDKKRLKLSK